MSPTSASSEIQWQRCSSSYINTLPVLHFPFEQLPDSYNPASTVLRIGDDRMVYAFQWCYLNRDWDSRGVLNSIDISSLSKDRVQAMPIVLEVLSKWFRFNNSRASTILYLLKRLGQFFAWIDQPQHAGRFERVLSNSDIALEALRAHHTLLRAECQGHLRSQSSAGNLDKVAVTCLSEIHGVNYGNYIEVLQVTKGKGTEAPNSQSVGVFASALQAIFDSATDIVLADKPSPPGVLLRVSATDDSKTVKLKPRYGPMRLMELACISYAGLVLVDSGANLSVILAYEEPEDLEEQLANPDRINLTQKAVKLRAGGKQVEVHLSSTTMTRLKTYLQVRQKLVSSLNCDDISSLFVQCTYDSNYLMGEPTNICALDQNFLQYIRRKLKSIGASLPAITLRQLRAYKQQDMVRRAPVPVAAKVMGHSVKTAIQAYCKAQDATRRGEISEFLGSLQKTVLEASESLPYQSYQEVIPIGLCVNHGKPSYDTSEPILQPDCSKVEGCFFCKNYRIHVNEGDMKKLLSARQVLQRISPLNMDSIRADRVYTALVDRIDLLLAELRRRQPETFETVRVAVDEHNQLTRFWANKLQQLYLLGMLNVATA